MESGRATTVGGAATSRSVSVWGVRGHSSSGLVVKGMY